MFEQPLLVEVSMCVNDDDDDEEEEEEEERFKDSVSDLADEKQPEGDANRVILEKE